MSNQQPKVLVVGAGPVGMFAALALATRSVPVQIVDTGLWPCSHSYALGLHAQSLELLKEVGLLDQVWAAANPVHRIGLYDASGRKAQIEMNASGPVAVLRQSALEDLLEKALNDRNVNVLWRHEVGAVTSNTDRPSVLIQKYTSKFKNDVDIDQEWTISKRTNLDVDFVLGADGHNSQIRRALALEFPELAPAHYYAVFEFKSDAGVVDEARIVLGERSTDVLWPLPDGYWRWSFQLPDYSDTEAEQLKDRLLSAGFGHFPTRRLKDRVPVAFDFGAPPALNQEHLEHLIAERAPWFTGSIDGLSWRTIVRFERRLSSSFGSGRVWLAGDAAHLGLPAGIQSMNLGLLEASDLAASFAKILSGDGSLGDLADYNDRWTAAWRQLHGLERGLRATPQADPWVAARIDRLMPCLPAYGLALEPLVAQLGLVTKEGELRVSSGVD